MVHAGELAIRTLPAGELGMGAMLISGPEICQTIYPHNLRSWQHLTGSLDKHLRLQAMGYLQNLLFLCLALPFFGPAACLDTS